MKSFAKRGIASRIGGLLIVVLFTASFGRYSSALDPGIMDSEFTTFDSEYLPDGYESAFDFLKNLSQAHHRSGGLIINFGTPARHKYTLGDWMSGFKDDFEIAGRTYSNVISDKSRFFFDLLPEEIVDGTIVLSAMAGGCDVVKIYLNDHPLGSVGLTKSDFAIAMVDYDEDVVGLRNEVRLFCTPSNKTVAEDSVRFSLDFARVVPNFVDEIEAETTLDTGRFRQRFGRDEEIVLAEEDSLTYYLPVPKDAHMLVEAVPLFPFSPEPEAVARLEITGLFDEGEDILLADIDVSESMAEIELPMESIERRACSITFRAVGGDLLLKKARLLAPVSHPHIDLPRISAKNVVVVLIDTQRADKLAFYNFGTRVKTPNLDLFAKQSIVFDRAGAPASWTKPSVTSLLSGLYPQAHTVRKHGAKVPSTVTLASEHFQNLGYNTAGFVANGYVSGEFGFEQGWSFWKNHGKLGKNTNARYVFKDAANWLKKRDRSKPFFLYVQTIDPHAPYIPPKKYLDFYSRASYFGLVNPPETAQLLKKINSCEVTLAEPDKSYLEALYDGEVSFHDFEFRRLVAAIGRLGLSEDTLIIVTSDHGEEFFEHGGTGHAHTLYEELLHVPLLMRLPGKRRHKGTRIGAEVGLVDVFPTICELLRVDCPEHLQGSSLLGLIKGNDWEGFPRASFAEHYGRKLQSVRMGDFKAIFAGHSARVFDLKNDPGEIVDISEDYPIATIVLTDALGKHLGRFARNGGGAAHEPEFSKGPGHQAQTAVIGAETEMQLRALGYTGD